MGTKMTVMTLRQERHKKGGEKSEPGLFTCEELRAHLLYDQEGSGQQHGGHKDNQLLFSFAPGGHNQTSKHSFAFCLPWLLLAT